MNEYKIMTNKTKQGNLDYRYQGKEKKKRKLMASQK